MKTYCTLIAVALFLSGCLGNTNVNVSSSDINTNVGKYIKVTEPEIVSFLRDIIPIQDRDIVFMTTDSFYVAPSVETLGNIIDTCVKIPQRFFVEDTFDCDDFVRVARACFSTEGVGNITVFEANAVVIDSGDLHSFLIAVMQDGKNYYLVYIEPQTKGVLDPNSFSVYLVWL